MYLKFSNTLKKIIKYLRDCNFYAIFKINIVTLFKTLIQMYGKLKLNVHILILYYISKYESL